MKHFKMKNINDKLKILTFGMNFNVQYILRITKMEREMWLSYDIFSD